MNCWCSSFLLATSWTKNLINTEPNAKVFLKTSTLVHHARRALNLACGTHHGQRMSFTLVRFALHEIWETKIDTDVRPCWRKGTGRVSGWHSVNIGSVVPIRTLPPSSFFPFTLRCWVWGHQDSKPALKQLPCYCFSTAIDLDIFQRRVQKSQPKSQMSRLV